MNEDKAKEIFKRFEQLKSERSTWENSWQQIKDLVRPTASDFTTSFAIPGKRQHHLIYDSTAPWALEQFSGGLHGYLTNPHERWFNITTPRRELIEDEEALEWLEYVSDLIYWVYSRPQAGLNTSLYEAYLDIGAFGTAILFQDWNSKDQHVQFRTFPLASCYILENSQGSVDTLFREIEFTTRQAIQHFGEDTPPKIKEEKNPDKIWQFIHAVFPRSEGKSSKQVQAQRSMPFASYYISRNPIQIVAESGFREFPYHVPRWSKTAGETYGRSPAMVCMADIMMLNQMSIVMIRSAQKLMDPPLIVPDDGFLTPLETSPGSIIFQIPGAGEIKPLITGARPDIGHDVMEQRREHISRCFHVDLMRMLQKAAPQTAAEIMERRDDQLRNMAPMLGRLQAELLGPMIKRTYSLLDVNGAMPPAPEALKNQKLEIEYVSPVARAQNSSKALNIQRFVQEILPITQLAPDVIDILDTDALASEITLHRDVTRKILRTKDEVVQLRQSRQEQQQMAQAAQASQMGVEAAGAIKDLSMAARNAPELTGMPVETSI